jgi:hypothetical protein
MKYLASMSNYLYIFNLIYLIQNKLPQLNINSEIQKSKQYQTYLSLHDFGLS